MKREWLLITLLGASRACIIHFICSNFRLKACRNRERKRAAFPSLLFFPLQQLSATLHRCAGRLKRILAGYWEPFPGFEMFDVILRNTPIYFEYFKQFGSAQVSASPPSGQARSTSSKYCSVCTTPQDIPAFRRFLFLAQALGVAPCPLPAPGPPVAPSLSPRQKECLRKPQTRSPWQQVIQESNKKWLIKFKISTTLPSASDRQSLCVPFAV